MSRVGECVLDASIIFATLLDEPATRRAEQLLAEVESPITPSVLQAEAASALSRKVRHGTLRLEHARIVLDDALAFPVKLVSSPRLHASAFELACRLDHPSYDCYYLALAIERDCLLLTCDRQLARAADRAGLGAYVELLGES